MMMAKVRINNCGSQPGSASAWPVSRNYGNFSPFDRQSTKKQTEREKLNAPCIISVITVNDCAIGMVLNRRTFRHGGFRSRSRAPIKNGWDMGDDFKRSNSIGLDENSGRYLRQM